MISAQVKIAQLLPAYSYAVRPAFALRFEITSRPHYVGGRQLVRDQ
jgi:hypothetical protein